MYNGDTAIVALQYSYLPSWISFLADRQKSMESGRQLIDAVQGRWAATAAADHRPKLALYGESLGSLAGQAAFDSCPTSADGLLRGAVGRARRTRARCGTRCCAARPGTTEVRPRYDGGRTVGSPKPSGRPATSTVSRPRRGPAPACCFCSTLRPHVGGHPICCSIGPVGWSSRAAAIAPR